MCTGYGGLALAVEGPSKVDIQTDDVEDGTCKVTYCPTEPGNYIVSIRFAEEHVPGERERETPPVIFFFSLLISNNLRRVCSSTGSPFTVRVTGEGRIRESISRQQRAASVASVGSMCDFSLKIPGTQSNFYSGSNA